MYRRTCLTLTFRISATSAIPSNGSRFFAGATCLHYPYRLRSRANLVTGLATSGWMRMQTSSADRADRTTIEHG